MKHALLTRRLMQVSALALLTAVSACSKQEPAAQAPPAAETTQPAADPLAASIGGEWRSAEDKARDEFRHPKESLEFWGLAPGMTILEVQPGGGWWSDILAPYAKATGGKYYATAADLQNPELSEAARKGRAEFEARFAAKPDVYGQVQFVNFGAKSAPLPENTFDFALSARSIHGWMGGGVTEKFFKDLHGALKPGGILAIEQHRANPGEQDPKAESGYVTQRHQGSSVRCLDAPAHQAYSSLQRRRGRARSEVRSQQVRCDRRVGSHDAEIPQARGGGNDDLKMSMGDRATALSPVTSRRLPSRN
jgi:predicted methyltransferase